MGTKSSIVFSIFILFGIYIFRIYSHDQTPVSLAKGIENFKVAGVPEFELKSYNTSRHDFTDTLKLKDYHEKVILINFWATWCVPCTEEFPDLINLAQKHETEIQVFAISVDKDQSNEIEKFVNKYKKIPSNFHILIDPDGQVAGHYGTQKIPETFIVNSRHLLFRKVIGNQSWNSKDFEILIQNFVEGRSL